MIIVDSRFNSAYSHFHLIFVLKNCLTSNFSIPYRRGRQVCHEEVAITISITGYVTQRLLYNIIVIFFLISSLLVKKF